MLPHTSRHRCLSLFALILLVFVAPRNAEAVCPTFGLPSGSEIVEFQTTQGQLCFELLRTDAPTTVWNFVNYVVGGDYDGTILHRSVPGFVIQGGGFAPGSDALVAIPTDPTIPNEPCTKPQGSAICTERGNERGTVAMARIGGQVNSATSQYFINLADNRDPLDAADEGFTVFANVLGTGMQTADTIAGLPIEDVAHAWWLSPSLAGVFSALPRAIDVPFFTPGSFGCWDPLDLAVVVNPVADTTALPDPILGTGFFPVSGGCGTQIPRGTFTADPGPPGCTDPDVLSVGIDELTGLPGNPLIRLDPATNDFLQYEFTCPQLSETLVQRELWRDDFVDRSFPELVVVQSASYQTVPEPAGGSVLLAALALFFGLGAGRRGERPL